MKIIHLLDRNLVIEIRDYQPPPPVPLQKGAPPPAPVRNPTIAKARALDKKNRTVSALLSIMEGDQAKALTGSDLQAILTRETAALKRFYRVAETDEPYLRTHNIDACLALATEAQRESDTYVCATAQLQTLLATQNGKQATKGPLDDVIATARQHDLVLSNPLILCAIACVYGSDVARGVLKPQLTPTHDTSFNAVMDLSKIKLVNYLRHLGNMGANQLTFETMDKALQRFSSLLHVRSTSSRRTTSHDAFSTSIDLDVFLNNLPFLKDLKKQKSTLRSLLLAP